MKFVNTQLAPEDKTEVIIITSNDQVRPNIALRDKVIDANFFQH
ncbi:MULTISPECIES: MetQ/NlpA family ABC transporter substrate-binding protein [unclassified Nostoc]|nr:MULTISPECIES: MetQ/NlpA family ABC transporter substrate-binding protein [unclassified Nostoc]